MCPDPATRSRSRGGHPSVKILVSFSYSPGHPPKIVIKNIPLFLHISTPKKKSNWKKRENNSQLCIVPLSPEQKGLILTEFVCEVGGERGERICSLSICNHPPTNPPTPPPPPPRRSRLSGLSPSGTLAVLLLYCCPGCPSASGLGRPR